MKKKVVQHKWKKKLFALILVVVLCFGSLLFMQIRYTHVVGLVSLQHQFVSQSQLQRPKIAFLFIARNRLPLELVWDAFFRVYSLFFFLSIIIDLYGSIETWKSICRAYWLLYYEIMEYKHLYSYKIYL